MLNRIIPHLITTKPYELICNKVQRGNVAHYGKHFPMEFELCGCGYYEEDAIIDLARKFSNIINDCPGKKVLVGVRDVRTHASDRGDSTLF